jgi:hypothetical protein
VDKLDAICSIKDVDITGTVLQREDLLSFSVIVNSSSLCGLKEDPSVSVKGSCMVEAMDDCSEVSPKPQKCSSFLHFQLLCQYGSIGIV